VSFTVLYVCTGNVCRSPMAELLFRGWVSPDADIVVASAGTDALVGHGIDRSSASALGQLGIDPSRHRARQFEAWMAADADLILTAERSHRDVVMTALPSAYKRTFTMKEFARTSRYVSPGPPVQVIAEVAGARHLDGQVAEDDDNMPDPYRGLIAAARTIAQQVTDTVHATIGVLGMWPAGHALAAPVVRVPEDTLRRPRPYRRQS
jgi:protein-tyrosine phosphatase